MATTTNYSWTTPDDTALVKDGAAAIRSLGTAIDSTVFTNAGNAIQKSIVDAAGDLIYGTADNTVARLALGTANQQLRVNSGATAPEWFTPAAAASGLTLINRTTFSASSGFNLDSILSSTYENYLIRINATSSSNSANILVQGRYSATTETGSVYNTMYSGSPVDGNSTNWVRAEGTSSWIVGRMSNGGAAICMSALNLYRINGSGQLTANGLFNGADNPINAYAGYNSITQARTYDGLRITPSTGTFTGQISVYGLASA